MGDRATRPGAAGLQSILLMPSFYGLVAWGIWLPLYQMRLIQWERPSALALTVFWATLVSFGASVLVFRPLYRQITELYAAGLPDTGWRPVRSGRPWYLMILHAIGLLGLALYVRAVAGAMGGIVIFVGALLVASYLIRWQTAYVSSVGTQLSYAGWIALALTLYERRRGTISRWWYVPAALQLLGNLLYIDRTRPLWILFTAAMVVLLLQPPGRSLRIIGFGAVAAVGGVGLFVAIATWVGKTADVGQFGASPLPLPLQGFYVYGTAGFAYFDAMMRGAEHVSYAPVRLLYPVYMALSALKVATPPPSQILDYYFVPFPTNVGTFLEPFFRDGGLMFVAIGILLHSAGFDLLGAWLLRSRRPLAIFAWANLAFANFIGFFTPKITNLPVWLFVGLGIASAAAARLRERRSVVSAGLAPA